MAFEHSTPWSRRASREIGHPRSRMTIVVIAIFASTASALASPIAVVAVSPTRLVYVGSTVGFLNPRTNTTVQCQRKVVVEYKSEPAGKWGIITSYAEPAPQ